MGWQDSGEEGVDDFELVTKVFCIGVWDMFHPGHLSLLKQAAQYGELTVGVVRDAAVTRVKGTNRPVINEKGRFDIISSLDKMLVWKTIYVDDFCIPEVVLSDWDIIVLGSDQHHIKGIDKIRPEQLRTVQRPRDGNCTSEIIKKIKEN